MVKVDVALAMAKVGAIMLLCVVVASVVCCGGVGGARWARTRCQDASATTQAPHWQVTGRLSTRKWPGGREGDELEGEEGGG